MAKKNKKLILGLLIAAVLIAFIPLFALKDAEFGGSDDAGKRDGGRNPRRIRTVVYPGTGNHDRRRTSGRSGKYVVLRADRDRRWNHRFCDGTVRGTKKMDER